jgi:hypothetical protein
VTSWNLVDGFLCSEGGRSYFFQIIGIRLSTCLVSYILRIVQGVLVQISCGKLTVPAGIFGTSFMTVYVATVRKTVPIIVRFIVLLFSYPFSLEFYILYSIIIFSCYRNQNIYIFSMFMNHSFPCMLQTRSRDSVVSIATRVKAGGQFYLFSKRSRPALEFTEPPIQWLSGTSPAVKPVSASGWLLACI